MSELTPEAVELLEAARQGHGPSENDRRRVLATLHASLGIGVPIALAPAAAEALASAQGSVQATASAAQVGSAAQQAASAVSSAAHGAGASAVAAGHTAKGALSLAGKLLTWKAGKLLLASVALSSAVGIGVSVAPRRSPDASPQLGAKSGQAAAFAPDVRSRTDEPSASAHADAGKSSSPSPAPTPTPERDPTRVAAAPAAVVTPEPAVAIAPEQAALRSLAEEPSAARSHGKYSSRRSHHRHSSAGARAESRASSHTAERSALVAPAAVDKPAVEVAAAEPLVAPAQPNAPADVVEAPNELALIRRAMTSLRDGDAQRALTLLEEHAARFPSGSFATERRGLHVVALCAAGRVDEGRREQATFLKSAGSSPIAARVRGACNERDD